jgi:hypothetical protein
MESPEVDWSFAYNRDALQHILLSLQADTRALIHLTLVCKGWQTAAWGTPDLWSHITVGAPATLKGSDGDGDGDDDSDSDMRNFRHPVKPAWCRSDYDGTATLHRYFRAPGVKLVSLSLHGCGDLDRVLQCLSPAQVAGLKELRLNGGHGLSLNGLLEALSGAKLLSLDVQYLRLREEESPDALRELLLEHDVGLLSSARCVGGEGDACGFLLNGDVASVCCLHDDDDDEEAAVGHTCPEHTKICRECNLSVCEACLPQFLESNDPNDEYSRGHVCGGCHKILCGDCTAEKLLEDNILTFFTCGCCDKDICFDCSCDGYGAMCGKQRYWAADPEKCLRYVCAMCWGEEDGQGYPGMHNCSMGETRLNSACTGGKYNPCTPAFTLCRKCLYDSGWTVRRKYGEFWASCPACMEAKKKAAREAKK